jgi:hypothetical protein
MFFFLLFSNWFQLFPSEEKNPECCRTHSEQVKNRGFETGCRWLLLSDWFSVITFSNQNHLWKLNISQAWNYYINKQNHSNCSSFKNTVQENVCNLSDWGLQVFCFTLQNGTKTPIQFERVDTYMSIVI